MEDITTNTDDEKEFREMKRRKHKTIYYSQISILPLPFTTV